MKHIILVNPISGNKKGRLTGIIIQKLLKKNNINAYIIESIESKYLTQITSKLAKNSKCRFYVVGGDGTLNEVVTGIIHTDSDIVVIPCGTGNDFVKSVSKYMSLRKIINISINKNSQPTDVILVNNKYYCINILNAGFDAQVAKNLDKFRNLTFLPGKMKYNLSIIYSLISSKNYNFKLRTDKMIYKNKVTLIAFANGKFYGGGICPCPTANISDGFINVCAIDSTNKIQKLIFLNKYKKGKHTSMDNVHMILTTNSTLVSNSKFPVSIDGEIIYTNKLKIQTIPSAVNIVYID